MDIESLAEHHQAEIANTAVICIMGPTASGKTALAVELAEQINAEIISVDSALIYRDMDIGTAKPDQTERQGIPHHLIDILSPEERYSVADFVRDANTCIEQIQSRGKRVILAGGTMMYFNALHQGISSVPEANLAVRKDLQKQIDAKGLAWAHQRLSECDPTSAQRIHPNDPQRTLRALEVYYTSGKSLTQWQSEKQFLPKYNFINFALLPSDRAILHERIATRFKMMLDAGLLSEVKNLLEHYNLDADMPSMRSVGYRQVLQYFENELSFEELLERGIIATRQLAKRQITWLRGWENCHNIDMKDPKRHELILKKVGIST